MSRRKTERLLNLVICLLATRRYLTAEEIRAAVPQYAEDDGGDDQAFRRMFERDKEELRDLGIPLETGSNSAWDDEQGYRIPPLAYRLPEIRLEPDEAAAVALAARAWRSARLGSAATSALRKLGTEADPDAGAGLPLEPQVAATEPAFDPMVEAAARRQPVRFDYRGANAAAATARRLEPWGVVSWHGHWYVVGRDRDRDAMRVFRLSRVTSPVAPDGPAGSVRVPPDLRLRDAVASYAEEPPDRTARLRVRAGRAHDLRRQGRPAGAAGDGWDRLDVDYADPARLVDRIAWHGADVVVEEPEPVRVAVVTRLTALAGEATR